MKIFLRLTFTLLCFVSKAQINSVNWNKNSYAEYNSKSFKNLDAVKQSVNSNNIDFALLNAAVFYRTNEERVKNGRKEFIFSSALENAAFEHSKDMVNKNFFSHNSPIGKKKTMSKRLELVGVTLTACAENIALNYCQNSSYWEIADLLVNQWMDSPGHRKNILNPDYKYLGCGVFNFKDSSFKTYIGVKATQNFSARDAE
ncbi:MAG: CAP domain-containing protein [Bacteroidota bacterium]|jgi:uncharacterized protein YkwD